MKKLTMTLVMGAVLGALAGCGGGGSNGGSIDNSAMTLNVEPSGDLAMTANSSVNLGMTSSVRRASSDDKSVISSMKWVLTAMNGETVAPILSNGSCVGLNVTNATAQCGTTLTVPQTVTTGKWTLTATAVASNGSQRSQSLAVNVDNSVYSLSAGNAQTVKSETNGSFGTVLLTGALSGTNGGKIIETKWVQVSGPSVQLSNAGTLNASFIPNALGQYTFQLTVVVDGKTINAITTVNATPAE